MDSKNWNEIKRGYFYEAALFYPSDTERPLRFFLPDVDDPSRGSIVKDAGNFEMRKIEGRLVNIEQYIIVTLKTRKVVVLSNDTLNSSDEIDFVQIAPIMSVSEKDKTKQWYKKMIANNHPAFVFIPQHVTGKECYVDISEMTSIHKGMLQRRSKQVPEEYMQVIEDNILECLDLGLIEDDEQITPVINT